jgi:two-component sensor histidine kinase
VLTEDKHLPRTGSAAESPAAGTSPARSFRRNALRQVSTQLYLLGLVAAVVVPLLAFAAFLFIRYAANERARFEVDAIHNAGQVARVIDAELDKMVALLRGLAASAALSRGDLATFHARAMRLVGGGNEVIVLRELDTKQLLNTQRPYGVELPPAPPIATQDRARLESGHSVMSEVYASPLTGEPRIAVAILVARADGPPLVLAMTVPTTRIRDALLPAVPEGWIVGVGDRRGTFVTRSARHDEVSGTPGLPDFLAKAAGRAGTFVAKSADGVQILAGYVRSDASEWLYAANVPIDVIEAPLRTSLRMLGLIGIAALALSALFAVLFGRRLAAETARLADQARALGQGRPVAAAPDGMEVRIAELALVGETLAAAAAAVEERAREREKALEQRRLLINELNHRVKNTLAAVQSIARQTLRNADSVADADKALTDRLVALAKAHDALTRENWQGTEFADIVATATIEPYGAKRFTVGGPAVRLSPAHSLALALALHELATNAAKYGALKSPDGHVDVAWDVAGDVGKRVLTLRWSERGGPPVAAPTRRGFGTRMIERSFASEFRGSARVNYAPQGVEWTIELPLGPG